MGRISFHSCWQQEEIADNQQKTLYKANFGGVPNYTPPFLFQYRGVKRV
nr:MAG TPA: hypothetical protein [Caudoviricetes sp.]